MKRWLLLIFTILLAACGGQDALTTETMPVTEPFPQAVTVQNILDVWYLVPDQSPFGGSTMLDPLEAEIVEAGQVEIFDHGMIFGNFGHAYSWIDAERIRVDGLIVGFGSVTEGLFYVFTIQSDAEQLRFLLTDGTPFAVFSRTQVVTMLEETVSVDPVIEEADAWAPCGYPTGLAIGGYAYVNPVPPDPHVVRMGPRNASEQTGLILPNELVKIIGGPQCTDGLTWWQVTSKQSGLTGWTTEGDGVSFWLLPCVNGTECGGMGD